MSAYPYSNLEELKRIFNSFNNNEYNAYMCSNKEYYCICFPEIKYEFEESYSNYILLEITKNFPFEKSIRLCYNPNSMVYGNDKNDDYKTCDDNTELDNLKNTIENLLKIKLKVIDFKTFRFCLNFSNNTDRYIITNIIYNYF